MCSKELYGTLNTPPIAQFPISSYRPKKTIELNREFFSSQTKLYYQAIQSVGFEFTVLFVIPDVIECVYWMYVCV